MIPQIFNIGPIPINSFGLMVALALFAGVIRLADSFAKNGIDPRLAEKYVITGGFVGLIGARFWYLIEHYNEIGTDFWGAVLSSAGFTFYGGFIISGLVLFAMLRREGLPMADFLDSVGPTLALGYAIGRLGCQLSGDGDYGHVTSSVWGMSYATGVVPTPPGILVYPTPFFESVLSLFAAGLLLKAESLTWWRYPYRRFALYLLLLSAERFFIEFFRIEKRVFGSFSEAQVIAVGLTIFGLLMLRPFSSPRTNRAITAS